MQMTRRQFVTWLGTSTVLGGASLAYGAGSPAEALSTLLKDGKPKAEKDKPVHGGAEGQSKPAAVEHKEEKSLATPEEIWADLMDGNRRFVTGRPKTRPLVAAREHLANGQHPKVIVLGCADSRVSPELVFDKNLGELFVVRTAGNIADLGKLLAAIDRETAAAVLRVGIADLAPRLDRIVIVKSWLNCRL